MKENGRTKKHHKDFKSAPYNLYTTFQVIQVFCVKNRLKVKLLFSEN